MILNIKDYPNFQILSFPDKAKIIGVHEINSNTLQAKIYNYDTEEIEIKELNTFGADLDLRILWLQFLRK